MKKFEWLSYLESCFWKNGIGVHAAELSLNLLVGRCSGISKISEGTSIWIESIKDCPNSRRLPREYHKVALIQHVPLQFFAGLSTNWLASLSLLLTKLTYLPRILCLSLLSHNSTQLQGWCTFCASTTHKSPTPTWHREFKLIYVIENTSFLWKS